MNSFVEENACGCSETKSVGYFYYFLSLTLSVDYTIPMEKGWTNRKDSRPTPTNQRPVYSIGYHFWYNIYFGQCGVQRCEDHRGHSKPRAVMATSSSSDPRTETNNKMQNDLDKSCPACMYTGVVTCTALSLYFAKLATDEVTLHSNRRFLWICSTGSFVAGAYRWYLG